jgi:hypothetical protein
MHSAVRHFATPEFWTCYNRLPGGVRDLADKNFSLMKSDSSHPSLHLKRIGNVWSVRAGLRYRALAHERIDGLVWFWIGPHSEYNTILSRR